MSESVHQSSDSNNKKTAKDNIVLELKCEGKSNAPIPGNYKTLKYIYYLQGI